MVEGSGQVHNILSDYRSVANSYIIHVPSKAMLTSGSFITRLFGMGKDPTRLLACSKTQEYTYF